MLRVFQNDILDKSLIKFNTFGCVLAIAASGMVCEVAKGKTLKAADRL